MQTLFALSIRQPWLDMVLKGFKSVEVRSWAIPVYTTIALHASQRVDFDIAYFYGYEAPWSLPRGGLLALAEIEEVRLYDEETWMSELFYHRQPLPFRGGSYGIRLTRVRLLKRPVMFRGSPMLFPLPEDIASKVLAADL
jgi:hypothetical protein